MKNAPIILNVKNLSGHDLENVELFDALRRAWKKETYENGEVHISSGIPDITYEDILLSIATGDHFTIGCVYVHGFDAAARGFDIKEKKGELTFGINRNDISGSSWGMLIEMRYQEEQLQSGVVMEKKEFDLDKRTSVKLHLLLSNETIVIQIYPKQSLNIASKL